MVQGAQALGAGEEHEGFDTEREGRVWRLARSAD
jgi:hypothetical protein